MSLQLFIDGQGYLGFNSISIHKTFLDLVSTFTAQLPLTQDYVQYIKKTNGNIFPIIQDKKIIILDIVNNRIENSSLIFTGYIEHTKINNSKQGRYIQISGRSLTVDIIDSTIDNTIANSFNGNITLKKIVRTTIKNMNLEGVKVIESGDIPIFKKNDRVTATVGNSVHDFLNKYCEKKQVYMNTTANGDINLIKSTEKKNIETSLFSVVGGSNNNIIESSADYDSTKVFYKYQCHSQDNSNSNNITDATSFSKNQSSIVGTSINPFVRRSRIFNFTSQNSLTTKEATSRAEWQSNFNNSQSFVYNCVIAGATYDGKNIWDTDIVVSVNDTFCDVNAKLLISEVKITQNNDGLKTNLKMVYQDSFNLVAVRNADKIARQQIGKYITDRD